MKLSDKPSTSKQGSSNSQPESSSKSHQRPSTSKSKEYKKVDENAGPSPKNDDVVFKKPTLPKKSFGKREVVHTEEEIRRVRMVLATIGPMDKVEQPTEQKKTRSPPEPVKKQTMRKPRQTTKRENETKESTTVDPKKPRQPNAEEAAQLEEMVRKNPTFIYQSAEETAHRLMNEVKKELKKEGVEQKEKYKSAYPPIPEIDDFDYRTLRRGPDTFRACFRWQKYGVVGEGVDPYFDTQNYTYQPQKRGPLTVDEAMKIWDDTDKELKYYMPEPVDHSYLFEWFDERDRKEEERMRKREEEEKRIQKENDNELYIEEQWIRILVEEGMDMEREQDSGTSEDIKVDPSIALNNDDEESYIDEEPERTEEEERLFQIQYQQQLRVYAEAEEQQREYEAKMKRIEDDREREKQEEMTKENRQKMLREQWRQQHQQFIEESMQQRPVQSPVQPPKFRTVAEKRAFFKK